MMMMRTANIKPADDAAIREAAALLHAGELVAFATETVYGLGADATNERAVAGIFAAKGRPQFNPLIVHVADLAAARKIAHFTPLAEQLAARFWPGPLTLVLPRRSEAGLSLLVSAGLDTVAVRVPAHPVAKALLRATDRPIAAPSANPSGRISPTCAAHVADGLADKVTLILDGGDCTVGLESTVIAISAGQLHLLRPGAVTEDDLTALTGHAPGTGQDAPDAPRSPGQLASHYAPHLPVRLDAHTARRDEAALGFGTALPDGAAKTLNLSPAGDLREAAANLFAMLRALDRPDYGGIAVAPIPDTGLGAAINDRLRRAAAGHGTGAEET